MRNWQRVQFQSLGACAMCDTSEYEYEFLVEECVPPMCGVMEGRGGGRKRLTRARQCTRSGRQDAATGTLHLSLILSRC